MKTLPWVLSFFAIVFLFGTIKGQLSQGGEPLSFYSKGLPATFQEIQVQSPDINGLIDEDQLRKSQFKPQRFAILVPVDLHPDNSGTWSTLPDGRKVWRLGIRLDGSAAISLFYTDFNLPEGVQLFVYSADQKQLIGAFTLLNNRNSGLFATELIYGDQLVLEVNVESSCTTMPTFILNEISYSYADLPGKELSRGFGNSDPCEVNINCSPEGNNWQDVKKGITRIQVKIGGALLWCSGSLIDNVRHDHIPYILTADHCAYHSGYATSSDLENWIFYFNYEALGCDDPNTEPPHQSLTGAELIANDGTHGSDGSDFYLLRLLDDIPYNFNVFYNGWSHTGEVSNSGVTIHQPEGDIKKISTYTAPLSTSSWQSNGLPSHWEVFWSETENNWGVTEPGSSGCPIFDEAGHIIGTLTGGLATCTNQNTPDYYGKFSYHWDLNGVEVTKQLKPWLDPDDTGITQLNGSISDVKSHFESVDNYVSISPNPASSKLWVQMHNIYNQIERIEIYDVYGNSIKSILADNRNAYSIDINNLETGVYFIVFLTNSQTFVKKIIKSD